MQTHAYLGVDWRRISGYLRMTDLPRPVIRSCRTCLWYWVRVDHPCWYPREKVWCWDCRLMSIGSQPVNSGRSRGETLALKGEVWAG